MLKIDSGKSEVIFAEGSLPRNKRKMLVVGVYISPKTKAEQWHKTFELIENVISDFKVKYKDPYVIVAGDVNRRKIDEAIDTFPDIKRVEGLISRSREDLDVIATNFGDEIVFTNSMPPLETPDGTKSDHNVMVIGAALSKIDRFNWIIKYQRKRNPHADAKFDTLIRGKKWRESNI